MVQMWDNIIIITESFGQFVLNNGKFELALV